MIAILYLAGLAWLAYLIATAPEGYETEAGFFYGPASARLPREARCAAGSVAFPFHGEGR